MQPAWLALGFQSVPNKSMDRTFLDQGGLLLYGSRLGKATGAKLENKEKIQSVFWRGSHRKIDPNMPECLYEIELAVEFQLHKRKDDVKNFALET